MHNDHLGMFYIHILKNTHSLPMILNVYAQPATQFISSVT
jgi:hypothetical protein